MSDDMNHDTLVSVARLTDQWKRGAVAFFGPEENECNVEARVAAAWNLPMIGYVSDWVLYDGLIV